MKKSEKEQKQINRYPSGLPGAFLPAVMNGRMACEAAARVTDPRGGSRSPGAEPEVLCTFTSREAVRRGRSYDGASASPRGRGVDGGTGGMGGGARETATGSAAVAPRHTGRLCPFLH